MDTEKLKTLREKLGLTQEQAAQKAGIGDRQAWNNIESGNRPNIQLQTLEKIARALGCHPGELLKWPK